MRLWSPGAFVGTQLAVFNRRYFLSAALLAFAIVSSYAYAEFPYDNLCPIEDGGGGLEVSGSVPVTFWNGTAGAINVPGTNSPAMFCRQNYWLIPGFNFPALPSAQELSQGDWMTESQELLVTIFGWTSLAALVIFVLVVFGNAIMNTVRMLFSGEVQNYGVDQKIDFSSIQEISGYIPQVKVGGFLFPFLATDTDSIDKDFLIGWKDQNRTYDDWNLIYDVKYEGMKRRRTQDGDGAEQGADNSGVDGVGERKSHVPKHPIFSLCKHYPPEWYRKRKAEAQRESEV